MCNFFAIITNFATVTLFSLDNPETQVIVCVFSRDAFPS